MTVTLENISKEIITSFSRRVKEEELTVSKIESSDLVQSIRDLIFYLDQSDKAFTDITWVDDLRETGEKVIKDLIARGKVFNSQSEIFCQALSKLNHPSIEFQQELEALSETIDLHLESILEVEDIIFVLRKDQGFIELMASIDES